MHTSSNSEDVCSHAMKQAVDAFEKKMDSYNQIKLIAHSYIIRREYNVEECVYHVLLDQWLRKTFPGVVFANNNVPEK